MLSRWLGVAWGLSPYSLAGSLGQGSTARSRAPLLPGRLRPLPFVNLIGFVLSFGAVGDVAWGTTMFQAQVGCPTYHRGLCHLLLCTYRAQRTYRRFHRDFSFSARHVQA